MHWSDMLSAIERASWKYRDTNRPVYRAAAIAAIHIARGEEGVESRSSCLDRYGVDGRSATRAYERGYQDGRRLARQV